MLPPLSPEYAIDRTIREEWGRILASITGALGDLQLAEDSLQDAVEAALADWRINGMPRSPAAWLIAAARRKAIDRIRRDQTFSGKQEQIRHFILEMSASDEADGEELNSRFPDERLRLIFTCCHPALPEKTRIALTLRTICGLTTDEIARAFLDDPRAMAQRLTRARQKIRLAGIPYQVPAAALLPERLKSILSVIYLIYNEGYAASSGQALTRTDLITEAIRLTRIMSALMPDETEIAGLLALLLLNDARRLARTGETGQMVALEHQNRARWDKSRISEGTALIRNTLQKGRVGPYQVQAAISALHVESPAWALTDWPQISALYTLLYTMQPTPVVGINRAMAASYSISPDSALVMLDEIAARHDVADYLPYHVARADLMQRLGHIGEAETLLQRAIALSENSVERTFLQTKYNQLTG